MTIPANIGLPPSHVDGGATLSPSFSGDLATTRRTGKSADGRTHTVDIIQSLPNTKGRVRHVIRYKVDTPATAITPVLSTTVTLTMDHPVSGGPDPAVQAQVMGIVFNDLFDEVALGQQ